MFLFDIVAPLTVAEAKTDYSKRRQRERDVDAGKRHVDLPLESEVSAAGNKERVGQRRRTAEGNDDRLRRIVVLHQKVGAPVIDRERGRNRARHHGEIDVVGERRNAPVIR